MPTPKDVSVVGDYRSGPEDSHMWGFAQAAGTFYSGPEAGKPAGEFEKIVRIIYPAEHARAF